MKGALATHAIAELFGEGFMASEIARTLSNTDPDLRAAAYESMRPPRSLPDGCFEFVHHLIWLEDVLEIAPVELTAIEAEGLLRLKRERAHFKAEHPACFKCGMPNEKNAFRCRECMAEIQKG